MTDSFHFYLIKEKDDPNFTYLHPSVEFLKAGSEFVNDQLAGRRYVIVRDVTYEALVEVFRELNPRQKAATLGSIFPTVELEKIVTDLKNKFPCMNPNPAA